MLVLFFVRKINMTYHTVRNYPTQIDQELGKFPGLKKEYAYGRVLLTDAGDPERTVWSFADDNLTPARADRKTFPTVAANLYMASSDAADTSIQITIFTIDSSGNEAFITQSTDAADGRTPVLIGFGLDINFVFISGTDSLNVGQLYFTNDPNFTLGIPDTASSVLAHVPIGYGCSPQALIRVPNNKTLIMQSIVPTISRSGGNPGSAIFHINVRRPNGTFITTREWHLQTGMPPILPAHAMTFGPTSIVEVTVLDVSSADTNCGMELNFTLVDTE